MAVKVNWQTGDTFNASDQNAVGTLLNSAEQTANKGAAGGYAGLDSNGNLSAYPLISSVASTTTAGGTTTLTVTSAQVQVFTGASTQTVKLPSTGVVIGQPYVIVNQSSGAVTVQASDLSTVATLAGSTVGFFRAVVAAPSGYAGWAGQVTVAGKTLTANNSITFAGTDGTTMTFPSSSGTVTTTASNLGAFAASTSAAIGVGSIELGNASDTTLTRSAAGQLAVEGVNVLLAGGALGTPSAGNVAACFGQVADMSIVAFGASTARAVGTGDFPFGIQVQRPITLSSVTFRAATADGSGNLVVELRKNGSTLSGSSTTVAAASQVAGGTSTGSWSLTTGDILTVYVTAVGTTPGKGLVADIKGLTA